MSRQRVRVSQITRRRLAAAIAPAYVSGLSESRNPIAGRLLAVSIILFSES